MRHRRWLQISTMPNVPLSQVRPPKHINLLMQFGDVSQPDSILDVRACLADYCSYIAYKGNTAWCDPFSFSIKLKMYSYLTDVLSEVVT